MRETKLKLYTSCLESLMLLFFALGHQNYRRWLSVNIGDLNTMTDKQFEELSANWTIQKTNKTFSNSPIDQTHEQENYKIKGKGGNIGLTENPSSSQKWMICGPEISRIFTEFEVFHLRSKQITTHITMRVALTKEYFTIKFCVLCILWKNMGILFLLF